MQEQKEVEGKFEKGVVEQFKAGWHNNRPENHDSPQTETH